VESSLGPNTNVIGHAGTTLAIMVAAGTPLDIALPGMAMLHDLSLRARFSVIFDQPVTGDIGLAIAGRVPFRWNPDDGNRVGLVPGAAVDAGAVGLDLATKIIWVEKPLCSPYHPLDAYDDEVVG
jgi:carotenoid cleavage dioxygenase-like enzyme